MFKEQKITFFFYKNVSNEITIRNNFYHQRFMFLNGTLNNDWNHWKVLIRDCTLNITISLISLHVRLTAAPFKP